MPVDVYGWEKGDEAEGYHQEGGKKSNRKSEYSMWKIPGTCVVGYEYFELWWRGSSGNASENVPDGMRIGKVPEG